MIVKSINEYEIVGECRAVLIDDIAILRVEKISVPKTACAVLGGYFVAVTAAALLITATL
ncbi:hypothetical protein SAMN02745866_02991 [Alteromonadaceae bacterium Bs31]|nr:hypothetical protein SAMN02745866_02991 [Alteromonadaceae bacterium Bs31]